MNNSCHLGGMGRHLARRRFPEIGKLINDSLTFKKPTRLCGRSAPIGHVAFAGFTSIP